MAKELISIKEFADKIHFFIREFTEMLKVKDATELMIFINKYFKYPFNSEHLNLWLSDGVSHFFYHMSLIHIFIKDNRDFLYD